MKPLAHVVVAAALLCPGFAFAESFTRPECPPWDGPAEAAEARCVREIRREWQEANFAALQNTRLLFNYMARPKLDQFPEARKAIEDKVEGAFTVRFSVKPDGTVYNVAIAKVTDGVEPLAKMWAETIGRWTFAKTDAPVVDVEHRRIYMYPKEDVEPEHEQKGRKL